MEKGQIVELTIEDMSTEGQGIGRTEDGFVVFAAGALPGDRALVELTKVKKHYATGRAVEILHLSESRRDEEWCEYQNVCGGCPFGSLNYEAQLALKAKQVRSRLERIGGAGAGGGLQDENALPLRPIVGADEPERCRNKAVMKISTGGLMTKKGGVQVPVHEPRIGFYQAKTHDVCDCADCRLQAGTAMAAAEATRRFMTEDHICSFDARWGKGLMKQMTVRTAFGTGEVMVIYDINGKGIPNAAKLVEYLDDAVYEAGGSLESVVIRNEKKTEVLAGKGTITDVVRVTDEARVADEVRVMDEVRVTDEAGTGADSSVEFAFEISANSFYQVNHEQMEKLYGIVRSLCRQAWESLREGAAGISGEVKPVVLDLYCGIGTIGLSIADLASHVYGIEIVKDAVLDANRNATINGIVNATYTCGKAEQLIPKWFGGSGEDTETERPRTADIAIVDPPRAGCRRELLDAIAGASIPTIIYVSCDPATLARDVKILQEEGYRIVSAVPVDMFPASGHVECACLLDKKKPKDYVEIGVDAEDYYRIKDTEQL